MNKWVVHDQLTKTERNASEFRSEHNYSVVLLTFGWITFFPYTNSCEIHVLSADGPFL